MRVDSNGAAVFFFFIGFILILGSIIHFLRPSIWRYRRLDKKLASLSGPWDTRFCGPEGGIALDGEGRRVAIIDRSGRGGVLKADEITGCQIGSASQSYATTFQLTPISDFVRVQTHTWYCLDVQTTNYQIPTLRIWMGKNENRIREIFQKLSLICSLK